MVEPALLGWDAQKRPFAIPERPPMGSSYSPLSATASSQGHQTRTSRAAGRVSKELGEQLG